MIEIKRIKERALLSLDRRVFGKPWLALVLCIVLHEVLLGLPSAVSSLVTRLSFWVGALVGFPLFLVGLVISGPLSYGVARIAHRLALDGGISKAKDLFCGFREELGESFVLGFVRKLYVFLWSLLLIVPGVIKSYAYSMAFFVQQEAKDKDWRFCLEESEELTRGYKGRLFLMDLSFLGWYLLGVLCLGVGAFWVDGYHLEARAHFYEELKRVKGITYTEKAPVFEEESAQRKTSDTDVFSLKDQEDE